MPGRAGEAGDLGEASSVRIQKTAGFEVIAGRAALLPEHGNAEVRSQGTTRGQTKLACRGGDKPGRLTVGPYVGPSACLQSQRLVMRRENQERERERATKKGVPVEQVELAPVTL